MEKQIPLNSLEQRALLEIASRHDNAKTSEILGVLGTFLREKGYPAVSVRVDAEARFISTDVPDDPPPESQAATPGS